MTAIPSRSALFAALGYNHVASSSQWVIQSGRPQQVPRNIPFGIGPRKEFSVSVKSTSPTVGSNFMDMDMGRLVL